MKVTLWGVRGSIPVTGNEFSKYGGNTTCVSIWENGWQLVLDGGSGIQKFTIDGELKQKRIDVLLTHLHLDHIQGLGFFKQLFDPAMEIHIWGPASSSQSLRSRLSRYLSPPLFPVLIRDLPCNLKLHEIENSTVEIGPFKILSRYVIHPGPTVGYRIAGTYSTFTFIPDHEPALGKGIINDPKWLSGYDLAADTDVLMHDAQYSESEYAGKRGWGHSSVEDAGLFASITGARQLLFTHHDPSRTDEQIDNFSAIFKTKTNYRFVAEPAREGMKLELR